MNYKLSNLIFIMKKFYILAAFAVSSTSIFASGCKVVVNSCNPCALNVQEKTPAKASVEKKEATSAGKIGTGIGPVVDVPMKLAVLPIAAPIEGLAEVIRKMTGASA
ncbi:MAG: hypothetical protein BGO07_00155 [Alphaproteobacteria bacterium 40-19]|nr:MAG: hypothetical protein BGO07_00155 [Alphaproteobacteria bacterium 40-19]